MCDPALLRGGTPGHQLHDSIRNRVWAHRQTAYANVIVGSKHPQAGGRQAEVQKDPRLQKKIVEMQGGVMRPDLFEDMNAVQEDVATMHDGPVNSFEEALDDLGEATDIMAELMDTGDKAPQVTILHFNDSHEVLEGDHEPIGGAARFVGKVNTYEDEQPLTVFSGNCLNPSQLSTLTKGGHMPEILNAANVKVAGFGNHDFDFGVENLQRRISDCEFPWLCANAVHKETGAPLCNAQRHVMLEHCGRRIGVIGLIEEEWLSSVSALDPSTVEYTDFMKVAAKCADELRDIGAELVIAITHFREENDVELLEAIEEIDLVLGGHDHHYMAKESADGMGRWLVKSGTDFRTFSRIVVDFEANGDGTPRVECVEKVEVTGESDEDPHIKDFVEESCKELKDNMGLKVLAKLAEPLDAKFCDIRTCETNCGNWVADVMRAAADVDVALCPAGALRADDVFPAGAFTLGDLQRLLPFLDDIAVLSLPGSALLKVLENGVSAYPTEDARFPQVSGVCFEFDASKPVGERVQQDSVLIAGDALSLEKEYRVVSTAYITNGKDGYDAFLNGRVVTKSGLLPVLPALLRTHMKLAACVVDGAQECCSSWNPAMVAAAKRVAQKADGEILAQIMAPHPEGRIRCRA